MGAVIIYYELKKKKLNIYYYGFPKNKNPSKSISGKDYYMNTLSFLSETLPGLEGDKKLFIIGNLTRERKNLLNKIFDISSNLKSEEMSETEKVFAKGIKGSRPIKLDPEYL